MPPTLLSFGPWTDTPAPVSAIEGDVRCDVVVLGGGYCGMSAARQLGERGADVVLLEAEFCGWGASARNAGHLTPTIAGDPQLLATVYRRRARELVRLADNAVRFVESLIHEEAVDCDYEPVGNVSVALTDGGMRRAARITRFLASAGAEVELVDAAEFGLPRAMRGGILERRGGVLNPGRLAMQLRGRLLGSPVRVFEGSPARSVERAGTGFSVLTPRGRVTAGHVLLATNAFTAELGSAPRRVVVPLWVTLAETSQADADLLASTGWTSRAGIYTQHLILESYRLTAAGTIAFGTRRVQPARRPLVARTPDTKIVDELARAFAERFPSLADNRVEVREAWGGWIAMTPSWLPVAGTTSEGLHYAVGFNGHGVAQAPYIGHLIADHIAGGPRADDLETIWRARPRYLPAPIFSAPALSLGWRLDRLGDHIARARTR